MSENLCLSVNAPYAVILLHPKTGLPIKEGENGAPASVSVISADSREANAFRQAQADAARVVPRTGPQRQAEIDANAVEFIVALTKGWDLSAIGGLPCPPEFTPHNARRLYSEEGFTWLKDQVFQAMVSRGNFMPASGTQ